MLNFQFRVQGQLMLLLSLLLLFANCGRRLQSPTTTDNSPASEPAPSPPRVEDQVPIVDDGTVNGPDRSASYTPTEYVNLPQQRADLSNTRPVASNGCNFVGEVWDFSGEGECGQIVETTSGYLLSITGVPPGYFLEGGSRIRFGFNYDQVSEDPCQRSDASVRITCLQLLRSASGFPRPIVCEQHEQPSQWIHELIRDLSATYVTRFPWADDRTVYLFETPSGQYLYDCRGFILCQPKTNCLQYIDDFSLGVQIFEG